jgi:hypothetical protein
VSIESIQARRAVEDSLGDKETMAPCGEPLEKCRLRIWHLMKDDWKVLSVLGGLVLLALLSAAESRFVRQAVYDKDQTRIEKRLDDISVDIKTLLKRRE